MLGGWFNVNWQKLMLLISLTSLFYTCIEPISATVGDNSDTLLVVDALISNEYSNYQVYLSRSMSNIDEDVVPESGATVTVEDDQGGVFDFLETEAGLYESNLDYFQGIPGRVYTLHISTKDGNVYVSDPVMMRVSSAIDSIYYIPGNHPDSVQNSNTGLRMFINGHADADEIEYLRWTYNEDWKFEIPFGDNLEVPTPDGDWEILSPKKYCWKSEVSTDINVMAFSNQSEKDINNKELYFIDSENTDKLYFRYSVLVNQYSISKEEYEFWRKLKESNTNVGNLFALQPYSINGNIKNENNPDEQVLGYFSAAGCSSKRLYIDYSEIKQLQLPVYYSYSTCELFGSVYFSGQDMTPYEIYEEYVLNDPNNALAFSILSDFSPYPVGFAFSHPHCCDCTLEGDSTPPDFWEDQ